MASDPLHQTTTSLRMAEALLGSLRNGCEINERDLEILIEAMRSDGETISSILDSYKIAMPGGSMEWTLADRVRIACIAATMDEAPHV